MQLVSLVVNPDGAFGAIIRTKSDKFQRTKHDHVDIHKSHHTMSDQVKEILDIPRDFFKDGAFFINRCTKPSKRGSLSLSSGVSAILIIRVLGDFKSRCSGIFGHGIHWICRQVSAYPYQ